jgi:UDP-N-acetylglucosamine acyltransferase
MPNIHPTAILEGEIDLADDVVIGPFCVLREPIRLGAGTTLVGNVYLHGPLVMGPGNVVYPFACLGFAPQHARFDPQTPGQGTAIGSGNTFREGAVVHRAFADGHPTTIGDRNFFMTNSHIAHDCIVGNDCTVVTGAALGGHVIMADRVTMGGNSVVHQFCRIGRGAMLGGGLAASTDVAPWFTLTGINICAAVNLIGLRRSGASPEMIDDVRWAHQVICRRNLSIKSMIDTLREREDHPIIRDYIEFIESSKRGVSAGRPKASRGAAMRL